MLARIILWRVITRVCRNENVEVFYLAVERQIKLDFIIATRSLELNHSVEIISGSLVGKVAEEFAIHIKVETKLHCSRHVMPTCLIRQKLSP